MPRRALNAKGKRRRQPRRPDFLVRVGGYLAEHGWNCVAAGPTRIVQRPGDRKFCYTLEIDFVGVKRVQENKTEALTRGSR